MVNERERHGDWMQTFTGRQVYVLDPRAEDIDPVDIAHALSLLCRYNGHVDRFYSVAEHCVHLSYAVPEHLALDALLHDATEAYVGDMIRPLKVSMPHYQRAEDGVALAIAERFGLLITLPSYTYEIPPAVKDADTRILLDERAALLSSTRTAWTIDATHQPLGVEIVGWLPHEAGERYTQRLNELMADVSFIDVIQAAANEAALAFLPTDETETRSRWRTLVKDPGPTTNRR